MTYTEQDPVGGRAGTGEVPARRTLWPLVGVAAGLLGVVATVGFDVRAGMSGGEVDNMTIDRVDDVSVMAARLGFLTGFATVALLLVTSAAWRRRVEPRVPGSTAAGVVSTGLTAAAGALILGYGWKGAMSIYGEGGDEFGAFDQQGRYVYYVLNDFGGFIGWFGVLVAAGGVCWMALRERTVSRWIGWVSVVTVAAPVGWFLISPVPGLSALTAPIWMIVVFSGLAFGKSTVTR
ncbi:hypothetical protein [Yinghuangia soli]|uniref:DUF4386 family protein n=1 Tax=Yinghuangia soli TaxID=2908204 RepID=A0AA41Q3H1_9ACTN|nr:hypothetical protein [Yinghuangia soli]MCF2530046.1 hypothetical protein [Yinghuangia soli]